MEKALRIKEVAKEHGVTLRSIAKRLGMHSSNMSAIASGARGVSIKLLKKISRILGCGVGELILPQKRHPVFKDRRTQLLLESIERNNYDGIDKTWIDRVMFVQNMHYNAVRRSK